MSYYKRSYPDEHDDRDRTDYKRRRRSQSRERNKNTKWPPSPSRSRSRRSRSPRDSYRYSRRSPTSHTSRVKEEIKSEVKMEDDYYESQSEYHDDYGDISDLTKEEKASLISLYCPLCSVTLGDPHSMLGHVRGIKHIQKKKTRGDNIPAASDDGSEFDAQFWIKEENRKRREQAKNDPFFDAKKFDKIKAKFNKRSYDNGQFSRTRQLYCGICGVTVHSRDTMENHRQGQDHIRRAQRPKKFECKICFVEVPCQNTLNAHFRGKDHMKRQNEAERSNKRLRYGDNSEGDSDLTIEEKKELEQTKKDVKNLQREFQSLQERSATCKKSHKNIEELRKKRDELEKERDHWKNKYEEEKNKKPLCSSEDYKVKRESKVKKEEYRDNVQIEIDVIDID